MSGPIITGIKGAYLQPQRFGFSETGEYAILVWEGTRNEVRANIPAILSMGGFYDYEESYSGAKDRLTARFAMIVGQEEAPVDTWELFANLVEKDILEAEVDGISAISDEEKRRIRDAIQTPVPNQSPALTTSDAIKIYQLMLKGVRSVQVRTPILKRTQTVSNNWTVKLSAQYVGRILSTASLISLEQVPTTKLYNLPNNTETAAMTAAGLRYGWYKLDATVRVAARQKTQMEQEWRYGLWSVDMYGVRL